MSNLQGQDAINVIKFLILEHPEIARVKVFKPSPPPILQERTTLSAEEKLLIDQALRFRKETYLPFWDSLFLSCFFNNNSLDGIVKAASFHNRSITSTRWIDRVNIISEEFKSPSNGKAEQSYTAISSHVELFDGSKKHIPMLDFHCPPSESNLALILSILQQINIGRGFILLSGKSYHFYGNTLINDKELIHFLACSLLYAPVIDRAWVAHQLIESACALRISPKKVDGICPYVVAQVL